MDEKKIGRRSKLYDVMSITIIAKNDRGVTKLV